MKPTTPPTPEQLEQFTSNLRQLVEAAGLHGFVCAYVPACGAESETSKATHHSIGCVLCNFSAAKSLTESVADRALAAIEQLGIRVPPLDAASKVVN